jgi:hypothetical protein
MSTIKYATWIRRGRRRRGQSGLAEFYSEDATRYPNTEMLERYNQRVLFLFVPTMTAVCTERVDRPGDTSGYYIDAFDVNAGVFLDDPFVIVGPDHDLTQEANDGGFVPTTRMENIQGSPSIIRSNEQFVDWRVWRNEEDENTLDNLDLPAPAGASAIAFAFYKITVGLPPTLHLPDEIRFKPPLFIPPGCFRQFETGLSLAADANKFSKELQYDTLTLSAKMIASASTLMTQQIMSMAEGDKKLASNVVEKVLKAVPLTSAVVSKKK